MGSSLEFEGKETMKSAKLLLLAYRSYKKGLQPIAGKIFAEAMEDVTAPELMERIHKAIEDDEVLSELDDGTVKLHNNSTGTDTDTDTGTDTDTDTDIDTVEIEEEGETAAVIDDTDTDTEDIEIIEEDGETPATLDDDDIDTEDIEIIEDKNNDESLASILSETQVAQLKAIVNLAASKNKEFSAKKIFAKIFAKILK